MRFKPGVTREIFASYSFFYPWRNAWHCLELSIFPNFAVLVGSLPSEFRSLFFGESRQFRPFICCLTNIWPSFFGFFLLCFFSDTLCLFHSKSIFFGFHFFQCIGFLFCILSFHYFLQAFWGWAWAARIASRYTGCGFVVCRSVKKSGFVWSKTNLCPQTTHSNPNEIENDCAP